MVKPLIEVEKDIIDALIDLHYLASTERRSIVSDSLHKIADNLSDCVRKLANIRRGKIEIDNIVQAV